MASRPGFGRIAQHSERVGGSTLSWYPRDIGHPLRVLVLRFEASCPNHAFIGLPPGWNDPRRAG